MGKDLVLKIAECLHCCVGMIDSRETWNAAQKLHYKSVCHHGTAHGTK